MPQLPHLKTGVIVVASKVVVSLSGAVAVVTLAWLIVNTW